MQKQCAVDGCEHTFEAKGARKFCDGHAGWKAAARGKAEEADLLVVAIDLTEKQLERILMSSTIEEKGLAVQAILEYQRNEE